ncbi:MAG: hypothetical protein AB7M05_03730 [Alphaproteobacteria bacterium]
MRRLNAMALAIPVVLPLVLVACGGGDEHKTVVVNPAPGQTVVVPSSGEAKVCPSGQSC